jgi:hypothetical protein
VSTVKGCCEAMVDSSGARRIWLGREEVTGAIFGHMESGGSLLASDPHYMAYRLYNHLYVP